MKTDRIETRGHTTREGVLNLSVNTGLADADVSVTMRVRAVEPKVAEVDENGWPAGFFTRVAGLMPDLERGSQGQYESRTSLE